MPPPIGNPNFTRLRHGDSYHGMRAPEYVAWCAIKGRCHNPHNRAFSRYGGRGIEVCERWRNSYENFLADMGRRPSPEHSIDRINNDGNYEPGNCRWATREQQTNNARQNVIINVRGESMTLARAVKRFGGKYGTIYKRIVLRGLPAEEALGL